MGRRVDVDDLLTSEEVAALIGVSHRQTVNTYLRRYPDFPQPVVERVGGRVRLWLRPDVERWARGHPQ